MDCSDRKRLNEVGICFTLLINENELKSIPILIYANKQDLFNVLDDKDVRDAFNLYGNLGHTIHLESSSALTGENILKGLYWLIDELKPNSIVNKE